MSGSIWFGLLLTLVAGTLSGNCMLPMKFVRKWNWENTWLVFSVTSLLVLPCGLALALVRTPISVFAALPAIAFAAPLLFGFGWGIAQALFGISVARLGLALGYAIVIGLGATLGTLVPLFVNNRAVVTTGRGALILCGVSVMVAGIAVSAFAGMRREQAGVPAAVTSYSAALAMAVLCGLMAPMLNYAFAFGQSIADEAVRQGSSREAAGYAVWPIACFGGFIPNIVYTLFLLYRKGTWSKFRVGWNHDAWNGILMAMLWMGAVGLYGLSSVYLGVLGTSIGWALFQIFMIMTANLSGVLAGEWRSAPTEARHTLWAGLLLLAAATALIAAGNR